MSSWFTAALAALGTSLLAPSPLRAQPDLARIAVVIGNNAPGDANRPVLRYADDDAVATHRLLRQAGVDSVLLATLDEETRSMYPELAPRKARFEELQRIEARLTTQVKALRARGVRVELLLFYSGHGDVEGGEGYVLLEDGRLTRSRLATLLDRIDATHNHLLIDACKSYFLVFERGPGGQRKPYVGPAPALPIPASRSNTGFVLSTSSDRESHEWERFRGGVFSHELRSALRGAADIDHDGRVSYAELGAFLSSANKSIGPRFRPDVMVRPPASGAAHPLLDWQATYSVQLHPGAWGHVYVETSRGERLLDAHPAPDRFARLWLPSERPLFVRRHDEALEVAVESAGTTEIEVRAGRVPAISARGATSRAFERLFGVPFLASDVERFAGTLRQPALVPPSAPVRDDRRDPFQVRTAWIGSAVTLLFLGSGLTSTALARREYERVERWLERCVDCSASRIRAQQRSGRTLNTLASASWGLAAAAGVTTALLFFLEPKWRKRSTELSFGLGTVHLKGAL
jgi:hypothetical protein